MLSFAELILSGSACELPFSACMHGRCEAFVLYHQMSIHIVISYITPNVKIQNQINLETTNLHLHPKYHPHQKAHVTTSSSPSLDQNHQVKHSNSTLDSSINTTLTAQSNPPSCNPVLKLTMNAHYSISRAAFVHDLSCPLTPSRGKMIGTP